MKMEAIEATTSNTTPIKRKANEMEQTTSSPSKLTAEQKARIERNKLMAKERQIQKNRTTTLESMSGKLSDSWKDVLKSEFEKKYFTDLLDFLHEERSRNQIFPPAEDVLEALNACPFDGIKVVIIGQDPYHGKGQAHGLSFSVRKGVNVPPSLKNIYQELSTDISDFKTPNHGCLIDWAKQGVLLLNAVLTVQAGKADSHKGKGWEEFTNTIIRSLSSSRKDIVFILWGKNAQTKSSLVDKNKHKILTAGHPSPFSANLFFGCKHFSKTNDFLIQKGKEPIRWNL
eukprot:TRINITY_DN1339_c0_g1_i1.p1 TRINITY_DN1339_c0_g1~~TRINITY_DN1339_c0_g1_i1.p1  ORF type:complete len:313 (+),score=74.03 TRINITY_DN1339_c0_g1_i1:84-941(+)